MNAPQRPRGIVVTDVGATGVKATLFDAELNPVDESKIASTHIPGPPYAHLDPEPSVRFFAEAIPEFDRRLPVDAVVPVAHGAALACLAADGSLALPVMDYMAEPPAAIVESYRRVEPPFSEVCCGLLPMALTHALQLHWQETELPDDFAKVAAVLPWIQYFGFRLCGAAVCEIASLSCQTQLRDVPGGRYSSLARARGWDSRFAPIRPAWEAIGTLKSEFRGSDFAGRGAVLTGLHDSSANYLRYLAAGLENFTLLSTGTWIIAFNSAGDIAALDPARDTATNTSIFGHPIACSRFFGGREFELVSGGAPAAAGSEDAAARLVARGTFALPSFTDSGGPMPGTGKRGRIAGPPPSPGEERASLAALYCALMCDRQLAAIGCGGGIVVDGPFAENRAYLGILAALRPKQNVFASALANGTASGAAVLVLMGNEGSLPRIPLALRPVRPAAIAALGAYRERWLTQAAA